MTLLAKQAIDCTDHVAVPIENDPNVVLFSWGEHVPFFLQGGLEALHGAGGRPHGGDGCLDLRQVHTQALGTLTCFGGHGRSWPLGILSESLDQPSANQGQVSLREELEGGLMVTA